MFRGIFKVLRMLYIRMEEILELFQLFWKQCRLKNLPLMYIKRVPFPCVSSIGVLRHSQSSKKLSVYIGIEEILELSELFWKQCRLKKLPLTYIKKGFLFPCVSSIGVLRHSQSSKLSVYI